VEGKLTPTRESPPGFSVEHAVPGAEPLPHEYSTRRLRRAALVLAAVGVVVIVVVGLLPGLGSVREAVSGARPGWLAIAAGLEVSSCLSYVLVFRGVFCRRMRWPVSYEIATAELAANSLLSVGGVGGLALGAWILRRGGMPAAGIGRRTVAFFLLTSLANVVAVIVVGIGLGVGILDGSTGVALGLIPAAAAAVGLWGALAARRLAALLATRSRRRRGTQAHEWVSGGVEEALALVRAGEWMTLVGAAGYMLFDVAVLGVCFTAFGMEVPPVGVLLLAYLIGQLGGLIPVPGGIGGIDGGLIGALVLYGVDGTEAAVAVLAYRALALWVPIVLGVPSLASVRRRLRNEAHDIAACVPGQDVEILGRGRVRVADTAAG
jgi:uncharacterized membrane protein YbhN (UPF0104 family)